MTDQAEWTIEIRDELGLVRRFAADKDELVLGRSTQADIQLELPTVSRKHARLTRTAGSWKIRDLGSMSGLLVNGQKSTEAEVGPEDLIEISRFQVRLSQGRGSSVSPAAGATLISRDEREHERPDISVLTHVSPPKLDISFISALNDFGHELAEIESAPARLERLCDIMGGEIIRAKWAMALRVDAEDPTHPIEQLAVFRQPSLDREDLHLSRTTIRAMQESGSPVLANNFKQDSGVVEMSIVSQAPAAAAVACPLTDEQPPMELLYVSLPPMFGSTEWLALIALAAKQYQQAEALWKVRDAAEARAAIERDLANARQIQRSILPAHVEPDGMEVAWHFEPCDAVGGDLVDVVAMPDGRWALVIADVTGHGLSAALATLAVHSIVQTGLRSGMPLPRMMTMLNNHLCDYLPEDRFVTMICAAVDLSSGEIECINAGHHAALVFDAAGETRSLQEAEHLPLGLQPDELTSSRDRLEINELLFLSTDGLTELPVDGGKLLGADGVKDLVLQAGGGDDAVSMLAEHLVDELERLRGEHPRTDDQTFLMARRRPAD